MCLTLLTTILLNDRLFSLSHNENENKRSILSLTRSESPTINRLPCQSKHTSISGTTANKLHLSSVPFPVAQNRVIEWTEPTPVCSEAISAQQAVQVRFGVGESNRHWDRQYRVHINYIVVPQNVSDKFTRGNKTSIEKANNSRASSSPRTTYEWTRIEQ